MDRILSGEGGTQKSSIETDLMVVHGLYPRSNLKAQVKSGQQLTMVTKFIKRLFIRVYHWDFER